MPKNNFKYDVTVIGAAIADVIARPVTDEALRVPSYGAEGISMSMGGDAANEAAALSMLGRRVNLVTKLGDDMLGRMLLNQLDSYGISVNDVSVENGLDTGINIVMVRPDAERSFITNPNGSLRRLALSDIRPESYSESSVVSFASIFVSPLLGVPEMTSLFADIRRRGCVLCADMTRPKHGEAAADLEPALKYVDYIFPNMDEARAVTGRDTPEGAAEVLLECGVSCAVIKTGGNGCYIRNRESAAYVPAYPGTHCIDTTGAGDNFAAGFICALLEGMSDLECARFANAAASISVENTGATTRRLTREAVGRRFNI